MERPAFTLKILIPCHKWHSWRSFLDIQECDLVIYLQRYLCSSNSGRYNYRIMRGYLVHLGYAVAQLVEALRYKPEGRGCDSRWGHFRPHYGPGVSNRNEYQEAFLWGKGGQWVGLKTLPPSCTDCLEVLGASTSWSPKVPSRPVMGQLYLYPTHSFISNLSDDRSTASSKTIPPLNAI
jgi:hypothetical protein